jgi:hypothetical protein
MESTDSSANKPLIRRATPGNATIAPFVGHMVSLSPTATSPASTGEVRSQPRGFTASSAKFKGTFALALVLFIAANLLVARAFANKEDSDGCVYYLRKFQAVAHPELVFIGSSMCKHVFNEVHPGDFGDKQVASVAYNLEMLSDSYIVNDKFLRNDHKPSQLVIGVGPRDVLDHDQPDPTATTSFRYLVSALDLPKYCPIFARDAKQAASMVFDKMLFLSDRRRSIQFKVRELFQHLYGTTEPAPQTPEELKQRSLKEYAYRYQDPDPLQFEFQMSMLGRIIRECRAHNIDVVVVSLPITSENIALLGQDWYTKVQRGFEQTAKREGARYINAAAQKYGPQDFYDSAHLNQTGARKVIEVLRSHLSSPEHQPAS